MYFTDLEVYPVPLLFFINPSKVLMRLSAFLKVFSFKMFLLCSYFSRKMCQLILLYVRMKIIAVVIFCFSTSQPQNVLNLLF